MDCSDMLQLIKKKTIKESFDNLITVYNGNVKKLCRGMIYLYCHSFHDSNIWCLNLVYNVVEAIENSKCASRVKILIELLKILEPKIYNFSNVDKDIVSDLLFKTNYRTCWVKERYANVIKDELIDVLSIFIHFIDIKDHNNAMIILRHILSLKPKNVFRVVSNDLSWFIFEIIMLKTNSDVCTDYVGMSRDLFFYKTTKKEQACLQHVMLNCLVVAIFNKTKNQEIDLQTLRIPYKENRMDYLYILPDQDEELKTVVENEKQKARKSLRKKLLNIKCKELEKLHRVQSGMNVVKLNNFSEYYK